MNKEEITRAVREERRAILDARLGIVQANFFVPAGIPRAMAVEVLEDLDMEFDRSSQASGSTLLSDACWDWGVAEARRRRANPA